MKDEITAAVLDGFPYAVLNGEEVTQWKRIYEKEQNNLP